MKICNINDCNNKHSAKGLCQKHYDQTPRKKEYIKKYNNSPRGRERGQTYDNSLKGKKYRKAYKKLPKVKERDKIRRNLPENKIRQQEYQKSPKVREYDRKRSKLPERRSYAKNTSLLKLYNITIDDYNQMLKNQDNKCAICGNNETATIRGILRKLAVDHDHKTGLVRSLLCSRCNSVLGYTRDDIDTLTKCIQYLQGHQ